jgi:hypothetical protein
MAQGCNMQAWLRRSGIKLCFPRGSFLDALENMQVPSPSLDLDKQIAKFGPHGVVARGLQGNKRALNALMPSYALNLVGLGNWCNLFIWFGFHYYGSEMVCKSHQL